MKSNNQVITFIEKFYGVVISGSERMRLEKALQIQKEDILNKLISKKKDTIHNIEVCQEGINLKDNNLEYHRWNLSAQSVLLTLLINLEEELKQKLEEKDEK